MAQYSHHGPPMLVFHFIRSLDDELDCTYQRTRILIYILQKRVYGSFGLTQFLVEFPAIVTEVLQPPDQVVFGGYVPSARMDNKPQCRAGEHNEVFSATFS